MRKTPKISAKYPKTFKIGVKTPRISKEGKKSLPYLPLFASHGKCLHGFLIATASRGYSYESRQYWSPESSFRFLWGQTYVSNTVRGGGTISQPTQSWWIGKEFNDIIPPFQWFITLPALDWFSWSQQLEWNTCCAYIIWIIWQCFISIL